jgi:hypothetical protein
LCCISKYYIRRSFMKRLSLIFALILVLALVLPASAQDPTSLGSGAVNFTVQNLDPVNTATVAATYVSQSGSVAATIDKTIGPLASEGFPIADSGLSDGFAGSAVVSANTEIVAFGQALWSNNNLNPGDGHYRSAGAYNGFTQGATKLYLPSLAARVGAQISKVSVQSAASPSTSATIDFTITFYDRTGAQTLQLANQTVNEGAQVTFDLTAGSSDLTQGGTVQWLGAAVIESSDPVAAVATTHWRTYSAAYSAITGGGSKIALPSANRRIPSASGAGGPNTPGWLQYTSVVVQNLDTATAANVTVTWYDRQGTVLHSFVDPIPANSAHGYNTRFIDTSDVPASAQATLGADLTKDWNGSVVITSDGPDVAAIANLQWTANHPASPNTASGYTSFAGGTAEVFVPAAFRRGIADTNINRQFTGLVVMNVGTTDCTNFDVQWIPRGSTTPDISYQDTLAPNIAHGYNTKQGSSGSDFPAGVNVSDMGFDFRGGVVINGAGCELVAIHNTIWGAQESSTTYNAFGK